MEGNDQEFLLDDVLDAEDTVSFTEVVDEEREADEMACGEDERTRLDSRRPGILVWVG